jgi:hypothetical protein
MDLFQKFFYKITQFVLLRFATLLKTHNYNRNYVLEIYICFLNETINYKVDVNILS